METQNKDHPSALHLAALALGKLKPDAAVNIQSHLDECGDCRSYLTSTPRNELAEIVRQAEQKAAAEQNTMATGFSGTVAGLAPVPPASIANRVEHAVKENDIPSDLYIQSKYRIMRVLGRGGMGTVYEAEHVRMKRPVAIKVINPELVNHPQAVLRFEEEIKAVASLDHANIARAFDAENIGSLQAFIMEFVRGQTLYDFLKSRGQLSVVDACRCVRQALIGLQHAHQQGLVHRDLKPQNLMLTRDTGQIKILDFGLAKAVSENRESRGLTGSQATMGTYAYMAPEQALDAANADIRADIYSLGCTLYYLIAGKLPFDYQTDAKLLLAHQTETPCPLHELCHDVPEALSNFVARMLAKNPTDRPPTPREAADALLPFARGESSLAPAIASAARPAVVGRGMDRWKWGRIAAALLALFGFGGWAAGIFFVRTPHGTIIVQNAPADANVTIDGETVTITRSGDSTIIAAVEQGPHHLKLIHGGREFWSTDVVLELAGQLVTVTFEPKEGLATSSASNQQKASEALQKAEIQKQKPEVKSQGGTAGNNKNPSAERTKVESVQSPSVADKVASPSPPKTKDGFVLLFNGRDRTGWKTHESLPGAWIVENGVLQNSGAAISQLYSERDDYENVHVRVKFRFIKNGSVDLYVRGGYGPKFRGQFPDGLEVSCFDNGLGKIWLGNDRQQLLNYDTLPLKEQIQLDFKLVGEHATVTINRRELPAYDEPVHGLARRGHIILQSLAGVVAFESVEVKELPADPERVSKPATTNSAPTTNAPLPILKPATVARSVRSIKGNWRLDGEELIAHAGSAIIFGDPNWTNIEFAYQCRLDSNSALSVGITRSDENGTSVTLALGNFGKRREHRELYFHSPNDPKKWLAKNSQAQVKSIEANKWYKVLISCRGSDFTATVDGTKMPSMKRDGFSRGSVGLAVNKGVVRYKEIRITTPDGADLWEGIPDLGAPAQNSKILNATPESAKAELSTIDKSGEGFTPLFNGKDLTDWDGNRTLWSVADGEIIGRTSAEAPINKNTFLIWRGGEPRDFRLKLQYRIESGNSGVQYRSRIIDANNWVVGGYQADIESGNSYSGILYEERGRGIIALRGQDVKIAANGHKSLTNVADAAELQKGIRSRDWNDFEIEARGRHLRHWINGQRMCDVEDSEGAKKSEGGVIALQLHTGPPMVVRFRNIMLKSLDSNPAPSSGNSVQSTSENGVPATSNEDASSSPQSGNNIGPDAENSSKSKSRAIDLLSQVQLPENVVEGVWNKINKETNSGKRFSVLKLPYKPKGEYDFRVAFTCQSGKSIVSLLPSFGAKRFAWHMDGGGCGFAKVDNRAFNQNPTHHLTGLNIGQRYVVVIKVRAGSISAWMNDKEVSKLDTDYSNLTPASGSELISDESLGISSYKSPTVFHSIEVVPVVASPK